MRRIYKAGQIPAEPGDEERMAEIIRCRRPPGDKGTERTLFEGKLHNHGLDGMPDWMVKEILADAKAAGISTTGKVWESALGGADEPHAWVSDAHDVLAAAEAKNLPLEGVLKRRAIDKSEEPKTPRLAEDIIARQMRKEIALDPGNAAKPRELREAVIEKHGSKT